MIFVGNGRFQNVDLQTRERKEDPFFHIEKCIRFSPSAIEIWLEEKRNGTYRRDKNDGEAAGRQMGRSGLSSPFFYLREVGNVEERTLKRFSLIEKEILYSHSWTRLTDSARSYMFT